MHALEGATSADASLQDERARKLELNKKLTAAVEDGNVEGVKDACNRGATVAYRSPSLLLNRTLLHVAARAGKVDVVRELLKLGAKCDSRDDEGQTPLHYAALSCHVGVLEELLKNRSKDADVDALDNNKMTPLHLAVQESDQLKEDILANVIDKLKEYGADMNNDSCGRTALCIAALNDMPGIVAKLIDCGANVHRISELGTAMHYAAKSTGAAIDKLVEHGAKVDVATPTGITPLSLASQYGNAVTIRKLLEHGAKVDYAEGGNNETALFHADAAVIDLLIENHATVEFKDRNGQTAVHYAASHQNGHARIEALRRHKAVMHGKDHDGNTPLHIAAQSGNPSNIKALIAVATASTPKANETTDIKNVCNHHHETPLDVAQKKVLEEMKKLGFKGYYTGEYQLSIDLLDKRLRKLSSPVAKRLTREWKFYALGEEQVKNSKNSDEMKKKEEKIRKLMEMQKKSIEEMIGRQHEKYGTFGSAMNVNGVDLSHLSVLSGAWHSLMQSEYISQRGKENTENVSKDASPDASPDEESFDQQHGQNSDPTTELIESKRNDEIDSKQNKMNVVLAAHKMVVRYILECCWKDIKNALIGKSDQSDESTEERSDRLHNVMTARALNINCDELTVYTKGAGNTKRSKPSSQFSLFPDLILNDLLPAVNISIDRQLDTSEIAKMSFEAKMSELMRCAEDEAKNMNAECDEDVKLEDSQNHVVTKDENYEYFFQHYNFEIIIDDDDGTEKEVEKNWFETEFYKTHGFPAIFGENRLTENFYEDAQGVYWGLAHYGCPDEERTRFSLVNGDQGEDETLLVDIDGFCNLLEEKLQQEHQKACSEDSVHPCESKKDRQRLISRKTTKNTVFGKCRKHVSNFHDVIKSKFGDKAYDLLRRAIRDLKPAEDMFGNIILKDAEGLGICGYALDHIFPWAKGGKTVPDNLTAIHWGANQIKSDDLLQSSSFAGAPGIEKNMNHNLDWSKLRCGIDMEEFIALCVYCTYDASRSSGAQARVNLEGNIQNKYKERIRGLSDLLVRRGVQNKPDLSGYFQIVREEYTDAPKCWHDVKREDISNRWKKNRELRGLQSEEELKQEFILEKYRNHGQRIVDLLSNLRQTSATRTSLLQSQFVGTTVEKWKQKVRIALENDKKRGDDYKFYALSEEQERDVAQAFEEGVLAGPTGGKMLALIWDLINTDLKSGGHAGF